MSAPDLAERIAAIAVERTLGFTPGTVPFGVNVRTLAKAIRDELLVAPEINALRTLVLACRNPLLPDERDYRGVRVPSKAVVDSAATAIGRIFGSDRVGGYGTIALDRITGRAK